MSKAKRDPAVDRTRTMVELVREQYDSLSEVSRPWVVCEEVANRTGYGRVRFADVLTLAVWPSLDYKLIGYEVKATKGDLKRELEKPEKSDALSRYCNEWWLVAWDESVLVPGIPADWGILLTREDDLGQRELFVHKPPSKRAPVEWDKHFVASMVRNAQEQSASAELIARISDAVARKAEAHGIKKGRDQEREAVIEQLLPLAQFLFPGSNLLEQRRFARDRNYLLEQVLDQLKFGPKAHR